MEKPPYFSQKKDDPDFSLREWTVKARISRENSISRRFSGSYIRSFREDGGSFRSNFTISSTASSPGYTLRDEIDPSTYSFTTALKALQAKSCYNIWEYLSPEGFALNSKWNEAEKYICNPLSGEVPLECLSAKTLSGRSFRKLTSRITMSAPLVYSTHSRHIQTKPSSLTPEDVIHHFPIPEKKLLEVMTRDVGTQSTPPELSSSSESPSSTPPIVERALKRCELEAEDSPNSSAQMKSLKENTLVVSPRKDVSLKMGRSNQGWSEERRMSTIFYKGGEERGRRGRERKRREGGEKERREEEEVAGKWVSVMDEEEAERETQTQKKEFAFEFQRLLRMERFSEEIQTLFSSRVDGKKVRTMTAKMEDWAINHGGRKE